MKEAELARLKEQAAMYRKLKRMLKIVRGGHTESVESGRITETRWYLESRDDSYCEAPGEKPPTLEQWLKCVTIYKEPTHAD